ncbi:hypothetical protein V1283_002385 [Bradyrhizobium sp. AZCC 2262]
MSKASLSLPKFRSITMSANSSFERKWLLKLPMGTLSLGGDIANVGAVIAMALKDADSGGDNLVTV